MKEFLKWALPPFQEYYLFQADCQTEVGENWNSQRKPPDLPNAELGFLTCSLPRLKQKRRETSCLRVGGLEGPLRRKVNNPTKQIDFSRTTDKRTQQTIHPIKTQWEYLGGGVRGEERETHTDRDR